MGTDETPKKEDDHDDESVEEEEVESQEAPTEDEAAEIDDAEPSEWDELCNRAHTLWDAGNNAELSKVLEELSKAPQEEQKVHDLVEEMRQRLRPDPVAIGLWVVTLALFCYLTFRFVLS